VEVLAEAASVAAVAVVAASEEVLAEAVAAAAVDVDKQ
jgi:hypothetical protein